MNLHALHTLGDQHAETRFIDNKIASATSEIEKRLGAEGKKGRAQRVTLRLFDTTKWRQQMI